MDDPSETLTLFDVSTAIATLVAGTDGTATFDDLGSGTSYGAEVVPADFVGFVDVELNGAALSALNAASGLFAVGGRITTFSATDGVLEAVFPSSGGVSANLLLVLIPEPSTAVLLLSGLGVLAINRKRL